MSRELQQLPNPDNVIGALTTGYQRQNNNIAVIQTGLDTLEPFDNGNGTISVPAGGVIDLNGVMFKLTRDITLTKPSVGTAYWIAVSCHTDPQYATLTLVTRPGTWFPDKQGYYRKDGRRTLGWVSLGEVENIEAETPFFVAEAPRNDIFTGDIRLPRKGWCLIDCQHWISGMTSNWGNRPDGTIRYPFIRVGFHNLPIVQIKDRITGINGVRVFIKHFFLYSGGTISIHMTRGIETRPNSICRIYLFAE